MMEQREEIYCFGCSEKNPIGLKLQFSFKEKQSFTEWTPTREYEGFPGVLHGGIIATIIDEVMAKEIEHRGIWAVTAEMNVKYLKKTEIGKKLIAKSKFLERRKKILHLETEIFNEKGEITAKGHGKYFFIKNLDVSDISER